MATRVSWSRGKEKEKESTRDKTKFLSFYLYRRAEVVSVSVLFLFNWRKGISLDFKCLIHEDLHFPVIIIVDILHEQTKKVGVRVNE